MSFQRFLSVFFLLSLLCGCESAPPLAGQDGQKQAGPSANSAQPPPQHIAYQPIEARPLELATKALPIWRNVKEQKPALVLMSFDPFLQPIPDELEPQAKELTLNGTAQDLSRHGNIARPAPYILPNQTLSAALAADFFSKVYWIFPSKEQPEQLVLDRFREQMRNAGFFTETEVQAIRLNDGRYRGLVRGVPFEAIHPQQLPEFKEPLVLHLDLSYFRGLYDNEIKTPVYDLIHQTATTLLSSDWQPLAVTLSYSTLQGAISLDTRFVLRNLAEILREPRLLTEEIPQRWALRAQALYAADMFTESKKLELYREAAQLAPEDATAIYDLFQAHLFAKDLDSAIQALDRATSLDRGYGAAYLSLADMAIQDGNLNAALTLAEKAGQIFPDNPFIDLKRAELFLQGGDQKSAETLLKPLQQMPWSTTYHAQVPELIERLLAAARSSDTAVPAAKDEPSASKNIRHD